MIRIHVRPSRIARRAGTAVLVAGVGIGIGAATAPSTASAAPARCEASALRGSLLGAAPIEPVTANKSATPCRSASGGLAGALPAPLAADAVVARTVTDGSGPSERGIAIGGLTSVRVTALPTLPVTLPVDAVIDAVPALTVPVPLVSQLLGLPAQLTVDIRPALRALLPGGGLPDVDLVTAEAALAVAAARCVDGAPVVTTQSSVTGLRVLGQDVVPGAAVDENLTLVDAASIDPSDVSLANVTLPLGLSVLDPVLGPVIQALVQPALDALPDIAIPATVANVKVSAGTRTETGGLVTQQALRVQASILGQPVADVVVGEASASAAGLDCAPPAPPVQETRAAPTATDLALQCTKRRLVLQDVTVRDGRVHLLGAADRTLAGRTVDIRFLADGRRVARARVRDDGSFRTTAPLPPRRLRSTNRARYRASVGRERSLDLKLQRRMTYTGVRVDGRRVTIAGRVEGPLTRPAAAITVQRRVSCRTLETVRRIRPRADGTFRVTLTAPRDALAVVYRLKTEVRENTRSAKRFPTFTLPRAIALG